MNQPTANGKYGDGAPAPRPSHHPNPFPSHLGTMGAEREQRVGACCFFHGHRFGIGK